MSQDTESATESTPLLTELDPQPIQSTTTLPIDESELDANENEIKYDRKQVLALSICGLAEPVAFFCILPFVPFMIEELGHIEKSRVGFYAGLIESLFSIVQMLTMWAWGKAADKFGRKPILHICFVGLCVCSTLFGFSQTLWQMITLRCAAGLFSGVVV
jgi:MFS family permease